jgi:hypothetical protein
MLRSAKTLFRNENGSAFIIALMVLVLLSFVGISLTIITETEMQLGNSEKLIDRTGFAAETGFAALFAQLALTYNVCPEYVAIPNKKVGEVQLGFAVDTGNLFPVVRAKAPYSSANEGDQSMYSYFFVASSRARRVAWAEDEASPFEVSSPRPECRRELKPDISVQTAQTIRMSMYVTAIRDRALSAESLQCAVSDCQNDQLTEF